MSPSNTRVPGKFFRIRAAREGIISPAARTGIPAPHSKPTSPTPPPENNDPATFRFIYFEASMPSKGKRLIEIHFK